MQTRKFLLLTQKRKFKHLYFVLGFDNSDTINLKKQYHYEKKEPTPEKDSENKSKKICRRGRWKTKINPTMPNSLHKQTSKDEIFRSLPSSDMIISKNDNVNEINPSNVEEISNSTNNLTFSDAINDAQLDFSSTTTESSDQFNVKSEIDVEENFTEVSVRILVNPKQRKYQLIKSKIKQNLSLLINSLTVTSLNTKYGLINAKLCQMKEERKLLCKILLFMWLLP